MHYYPCPKCEQKMTVAPWQLGTIVYCRECGAKFEMPETARDQIPYTDESDSRAVWVVVGLAIGGVACITTTFVCIWLFLFSGVLSRPKQDDVAPNGPIVPPASQKPNAVPTAESSNPAEEITSAFVEPNATTIIAAPLTSDSVELQLPSKVVDSVIGGGGRYWCLLLAEPNQLAVFDVNQAKVVKFLPLEGRGAKIAAGMNKLLFCYPEKEVIVRYDLNTMERDVTVNLPFRGMVKNICLGGASSGPLLLCYSTSPEHLDTITFLDITTLRELHLTGQNTRMPPLIFKSNPHFRAGANGRVFGGWVSGQSPTGLRSILVSDAGMKPYYIHDSAGNVIPGSDGIIFAGTGIYSTDLKLIRSCPPSLQIPAQRGNLYLDVMPATHFQGQLDPPVLAKISVCCSTDSRPIVSLDNLKIIVAGDRNIETDFTQDKRFLFSLEGNLIGWIPPTNDRLRLFKFNLDSALERSGVDYLFVTSVPPKIAPGQMYRYPIKVTSKKGGVKFNLDTGPQGMVVSNEGIVTWDAPTNWIGSESIVVSISDKTGQEVTHALVAATNASSQIAGPQTVPRPNPVLPTAPAAPIPGRIAGRRPPRPACCVLFPFLPSREPRTNPPHA